MSIFKTLFKKGGVLIVTAGVFCLLAATAGAEPEPTAENEVHSQVRVQIDGRSLSFDQPPILKDGRVMVPLRGVFESLGADVVYNSATRNIKATREGRVVELALGNDSALIDGRSSYLDVPATVVKGRTLVPLRFVSEALGADVDWISATRTVAIESTGPVAELQPIPDPEIKSVSHSARRTLGRDDELEVTMTGTPGGEASFKVLGLSQDLPMTEVAPGRYEGSLRIEPDMEMAKGTVVTQLLLRGQTVAREAQEPVVIDSGVSAAPGMTLAPARGNLVATETPLIEARFQDRVRPESIRLTLDGRDVSTRADRAADLVSYLPEPRLVKGEHTVSVRATTEQGRTLSEQWTFQVSSPLGDGRKPSLMVSNLGSGQDVDETFDIEGRTTPKSRIQITAERPGTLEPDRVEAVGVADDEGYFDIEVDTRTFPSDIRLDVEVIAIDEEGDVSQPVTMDLIRR